MAVALVMPRLSGRLGAAPSASGGRPRRRRIRRLRRLFTERANGGRELVLCREQHVHRLDAQSQALSPGLWCRIGVELADQDVKLLPIAPRKAVDDVKFLSQLITDMYRHGSS